MMKNKTLSAVFIALVVLSSVNSFAVSAFASSTKPEFRSVIVGFKANPSEALIQQYGGRIKYSYNAIPAIACWLPPQAIAALENNPQIEYIEEDTVVTISARQQWRNYAYLAVYAFLDGVPVSVPYYVNGVQKGITPGMTFTKKGTYTVSVTCDGQTQEQTAVVLGNLQITMVVFEFTSQQETGYLNIQAQLDNGTTVSANIDIYNSGNLYDQDTTPFTIEVEPDSYDLIATYKDQTQYRITEVIADQTTTETFTFEAPEPPPPPEQGILQITTTPVTGEIFIDGASEGLAPVTKDIDIGTYTISFSDVLDYITPEPQTVEVYVNQTSYVEGVYEPVAPPAQGTLQITTTPITGEVFINSISQGLAPVIREVDSGSYTISFGDVSGYLTPAPQTVDVYESQITYIEGVYELILPPAQGTLQITTTPVAGEIFIDGISEGPAPVTKEVDVGAYTISFGDVSGYITPESQTVDVYENQITSVEGAYHPVPPDPDPEVPWGVDRIDADLAWNTAEGLNIQVAILDTGLDKDHPDLKDNILAGISFIHYSYPWLWNPGAWDDDHGHGTWCAGIVGAIEDDLGVKGVAPVVDLVAVKVLDSSGSGYMSDIIAGIEWCMDNCIEVISMSFGGPSYSSAFENVCNSAYEQGIVLVAASGNEGDGDPNTNDVAYPAKFDSVIAVSGIDENDVIASFSSDGAEVDITAPAVDIKSTWRGGGYATHSGTSGACPHVSGTFALLLSLDITLPQFEGYDLNGDGKWDPIEARNRLCDTSDDLGDAGRDVFYGYGLVDTQEAVTGVQTTP